MSRIDLRISNQKKEELKDYCTSRKITVSKLLMNYIDTLLSKSNTPVSKKNSVKKPVLIKLYHCPHCGKDITHLDTPSRLTHLQNCESRHNS